MFFCSAHGQEFYILSHLSRTLKSRKLFKKGSSGLESSGRNIQMLKYDSELTVFSAVEPNAPLSLDNDPHCLCPDSHAELCGALHRETTIPIQ